MRVNAVPPGPVDTPLIHDSSGALYDYIEPLVASHPIGRIARPEKMGDAVRRRTEGPQTEHLLLTPDARRIALERDTA